MVFLFPAPFLHKVTKALHLTHLGQVCLAVHATSKTSTLLQCRLLKMTDVLAKWAAALDTFDGIKHCFQAPGEVEKALNSIALEERVLLFRGSNSEIRDRLSAYDTAQGKLSISIAAV